MKNKIMEEYRVDPDTAEDYEFDHWYPLAVGGSTDLSNLWPQPISESRIKDRLEQKLYNQISDGDITQEEAIHQIDEWGITK
jgi:hypothetical protein